MTADEIIERGLFEAAVQLMDDEIREKLLCGIAPCTVEEFLESYMEKHEEKYGVGFVICE